MDTVLALDVVADIRRITNDAGGTRWGEPVLVANINAAVRRVMSDRPAACYTSPIAFDETMALVGTGTGAALAATDTLPIDAFWRDAVTHYAAYLCFSALDRSQTNTEYADRELKRYEEAL